VSACRLEQHRDGATHPARSLEQTRREQAGIYAFRACAIESHCAMNFRDFEEALAYLCRRDGCPEAFVTGQVRYSVCEPCRAGLLHKISIDTDWHFCGLGRQALSQLETRHPDAVW
jgi:hypothetical protein